MNEPTINHTFEVFDKDGNPVGKTETNVEVKKEVVEEIKTTISRIENED